MDPITVNLARGAGVALRYVCGCYLSKNNTFDLLSNNRSQSLGRSQVAVNMRPRPTPRFSLPAIDRRDLKIRFRSQSRVVELPRLVSPDDGDGHEEPEASARAAQFFHSGTDIVRVKCESGPRVSSEEEVLAHATGAPLDLQGPTIAVINSHDHPGDEESEGEDETGEHEDRHSTDYADESRLPRGPEDDELRRLHESLPLPEKDGNPNDDEEESVNARAGEFGVNGAPHESA